MGTGWAGKAGTSNMVAWWGSGCPLASYWAFMDWAQVEERKLSASAMVANAEGGEGGWLVTDREKGEGRREKGGKWK